MTLGGIAAAIGLIIDDAIVIIEYIFSHYVHVKGKVQSPVDLVKSIGGSIHDLMPAIIGSTASTIVIHIPLAFLGGVTGAFFASLSITMVFALLISFILSITLAPLMASWFLRHGGMEEETEQSQSRLANWYANVMRWLLGRRILVIPMSGILLLLAYLAFTRLGSSFMPEMDEGTFVLDYHTPYGTSLNETHRVLRHVEDLIQSVPEVESYSRRTGTQLGFFITEPNRGDYLVKLKAHRTRSIDEVITDIRGQIHAVEPSLAVDFGQMMMDMIGRLLQIGIMIL